MNKKFLDDNKFIRKEIEEHVIFPLAFQNSEEKMKKAMIAKGQLCNREYVSKNIDPVIYCLIEQYFKSTFYTYGCKVAEPASFVFDDSPDWKKELFKKGELYDFNIGRYSYDFPMYDLVTVQSYLFNKADEYINNELKKDKNFRINLNYLRSLNEISTYEKAIPVAYKWEKEKSEKWEREILMKEEKQNKENKAVNILANTLQNQRQFVFKFKLNNGEGLYFHHYFFIKIWWSREYFY